jgi:hypothetical protein
LKGWEIDEKLMFFKQTNKTPKLTQLHQDGRFGISNLEK